MNGNQIGEELLPWVWAVEEQLWILSRLDAVLIRAADDGEFREWIKRFQVEYRLGRGRAGRAMRRHRGIFADVCEYHFQNAPRNLDDAQEIWIAAVEDFQRRARSRASLWSAFLKAFWFHQPNHVPMYDRRAHLGLSRELRRLTNRRRLTKAVREDNFLIRYQEFLGFVDPLIDEAIALVPRAYPYRLRVADKYLWLQGGDGKDDPVGQFEKGLEIAPYE